jgi:hypothetical protein
VVSAESVEGIEPVKRFVNRESDDKFTNLPKYEGMVPIRELKLRSTNVNEISEDSVIGREPVR